MALTPAQLETLREIALLTNLVETNTYASNLLSVQETSLVNIIDNEWSKVRFKVGHLVPNRDELLFSKIEQRRQIRYTVRMMLGLPPVSDYEIEMAELDGTYGSVIPGGGKGSGSGGAGLGEFGVFQTRNGSDGSELS